MSSSRSTCGFLRWKAPSTFGKRAAASLILAAGLMALTLAQLRLSKASEAGKTKK